MRIQVDGLFIRNNNKDMNIDKSVHFKTFKLKDVHCTFKVIIYFLLFILEKKKKK